MKAEIARLGRYAKTRTQAFSPAMPCEWQALSIENPETGLPFGDSGAWELICRLLDEQPEIFIEKKLDKPPGAIAYWAVVTLADSVEIYVKIQLWNGKAHGRSFHRSIGSSK